MSDASDLIEAVIAIARDPGGWEKRIADMNAAAGNLKEARKIEAETEKTRKAAAADLETARTERAQAERALRDTAAQSNANAVRERELKEQSTSFQLRMNQAEAEIRNHKANLEAREADLEAREKIAAKKLNDASKLMASYDEAKHKAALKLAS